MVDYCGRARLATCKDDGRAGQRGSTNLLDAEEVRGSIPLSSELAHSSAHTGGAGSAWGSRKSGTLSTTIECPRGGGHRAATRCDSVDFRIRRRAHDVERVRSGTEMGVPPGRSCDTSGRVVRLLGRP